MAHSYLFSSLAVFLGLWMTWGVGANDLSNVLSTTIGSKSLSVKLVLIIAVACEFAGAFLASGSVTETIRHSILNLDMLNQYPNVLIFGMLGVMTAGVVWMTFASYSGLPVSITHTIIGSIVGFGCVVLGRHGIFWPKVILIGVSWIFAPLLSGIIAFFLFSLLQVFIVLRANPYRKARVFAPIFLFLIGFLFAGVSVLKGLRHFNVDLPGKYDWLVSIAMGLSVMGIGWLLILNYRAPDARDRHAEFDHMEKIFGILMIFAASAMVFAHGSNDVANAVGPMTLIISLLKAGGNLQDVSNEPILWVLGLGCVGILIGFLTYGRRVIETVGHGITSLTPSRAFAATLSAAATTVLATSFGIPISTTQILVGAIFGVGLARGIGALNLNVIRNIFMSWAVTLPAGAILSTTFYYIYSWLFRNILFANHF